MIDLIKIFNNNICSFDCAKRLKKETGITAKFTGLGYNEHKEITTDFRIEEIDGNFKLYPAISLTQIIILLESAGFINEKCKELSEKEHGFKCEYAFSDTENISISAFTLVNLLTVLYIEIKILAK